MFQTAQLSIDFVSFNKTVLLQNLNKKLQQEHGTVSLNKMLVQQDGNNSFHEKVIIQNFGKTVATCTFLPYLRKYLLQPLPKSNPYQKHEPTHPYTLIDPTNPSTTSPSQSNCPNDLLHQPSLRIFCSNCKKQITHQVHSSFDHQELCIGCFSNTETMPDNFQIVEKLDYPLFEPAWTVYQEVLLLDCLERFGFGNWKDISQYMQYFGAKFTMDEIETHYNTFYLADRAFSPRFSQPLIDLRHQSHNPFSTTKPHPPNQVSMASLATTTHHRQDSAPNYPFQQIDDFSHQALTDPLPPHLATPTPIEQKITGYNSLRRQFEVDFDQTAEKNLANLEFRDDDLPEEKEVKFRMIQEYNGRLGKRYQVHDFLIEHKLLDLEHQKELQEGRTEYEKQAGHQLKRFMRFSTFEEHNELVRRVALQKELKSIIEGMRSYRRTSHTGRLKETFDQVRKHSLQHPSTPSRSRGRPRKIIHVDNSQKSTTSNSESTPGNNKRTRNEEEVFRRLRIDMKDLREIVKEAGGKGSGQGFRYKGVEVVVVDRQ